MYSKSLVVAIAGVLAIALAWVFRPLERVEVRAKEKVSETKLSLPVQGAATKAVRVPAKLAEMEMVWVVPELAERVRALNAPAKTPEEDVALLQDLLTLFRRANGAGNPICGSHEEVVRQLAGRNAKGLALLPSDLACITKDGQLLDRWGTPYFFHSLSAEVMEIRSAGPDRVLWTRDDVPRDWDENKETANKGG